MDSPSEPAQLGLFIFMVANADSLFNGEYLENLKKTADDVVSERQLKKVNHQAINKYLLFVYLLVTKMICILY